MVVVIPLLIQGETKLIRLMPMGDRLLLELSRCPVAKRRMRSFLIIDDIQDIAELLVGVVNIMILQVNNVLIFSLDRFHSRIQRQI